LLDNAADYRQIADRTLAYYHTQITVAFWCNSESAHKSNPNIIENFLALFHIKLKNFWI